ncbi:hypothetical protein [Micromonospora sp. CNB394]|uniref:hypothetical protein n=1 Tax=Micromonospora sp. CNB394 TaxID=1169151 RepID=UPI0003A2716D|nr:hypothetical protein [Micromonospora sp. CNB394]
MSKGTAQKVGLAQALLRPPGLLVLDEPWEGLDATARESVPEIIGAVLANGTVTEEASPGGAALVVVELAVPAAGLVAAVARLRADGHQIIRVREHAVPPPATHPVPASAGPSGTGARRCRPRGRRRFSGRGRPIRFPGSGRRRGRGLRPARAGAAGGPVIALIRLRLTGFLRTGRALAPVPAGLLVLGVRYGGGPARGGARRAGQPGRDPQRRVRRGRAGHRRGRDRSAAHRLGGGLDGGGVDRLRVEAAHPVLTSGDREHSG